MKTHSLLSLLAGLLVAHTGWAQSPEVYTAAADTFVQVDVATNHGGWDNMRTKFTGTVAHRRYSLMRFTRSGTGAVDNALLHLALQNAGSADPSLTFEVWGLNDGADCESFVEWQTYWTTCDAFGDQDLDRASATLFDGDPSLVGVQPLGTFVISPGDKVVNFAPQALADFVGASSNDVITLLIAQSVIGGGITAFATKEHATLDPPTLYVNLGAPVEASALVGVTDGWTASGLGAEALGTGTLLGQAVSYNGIDPGLVRLRSGGDLKYQESDDDGHSVGDEVSMVALLPVLADLLPMEMGSFSLSSAGAYATHTVTFERTYANPVFFAWVASYAGTQPVSAYPDQVGATSAVVRMAEDSSLDGIHAAETIHWAVFEAGVYDLGPHGIVEVGTGAVTNTGVDDFAPVSLQRSFDHGAAVVVQPQGNGLGGYQGTRMRRTVEASALTGFEVRHMFDRGAESSYPAVTGPMGWLVFGQAGGMLPTTVVRETITEETHWAPGAGTIIQSSDARLEWTADANLRLVSSRNGDTMWETGAFGAASVAELVFAPAPAGDGLLRIRGTSGADLWVMESEGQTGHTLGIDGCTVGVANDSTMVWSQSGSDKDCLLAVMRINAMQAIPYTEPQVLLETPEAQLDWKADGDLVLYDRTDGSVLWSWGGFTPTELAAHQVELRYQDGSLVAGGSGGEVLRELEMPYWWTDRLPDHLVLSRCSFSAFSAWDSNNLRLPVWTVGGSACTDVVVSLNAAGDRMEVAGTQDADDITLELIWNQGVVWVDGMVLAIGSNSLTEVTHYVVDAGAGDDSVEVSCSDCGAVTVLGGAGTDTIHWAGWSSPAYYSSYFDTGTGVGDTIKVEMTNHALAQDFPSNVVVSAASATGAATIEVIHPADRDDETDWAFGTCYLSRYDPDAMAVNCGTTVPFGEGNNVAEAFELVEERGFGNSNFGAGYAIDVGIGIGQDGSTKRVGGTPLLIEAKLLGQTKNLIRAAAEVTESGGVVGAGAELVVADLTVWEAEVAVPVVTIAGGYTHDQEFWTYGKSIDLGLLSVTLTAEIVGSAGFEVAGEVSGGTVGLSVTPSLGLTVSADASASFACARAGISGELTLLSVAMPMSLEVDLSSGAYSADGLLELGSLSGSVRAYASACFVSASKTLVSFAGFFAEIPLFNVYGLAW